MTIAQLLETVLGKSCCFDGDYGDGTAFRDKDNIADEICEKLKKHGYERHGNEELINGMTGEPLEAKILIGPVFYQRLKHMVSDKIHCLDFLTEVLTLDGWKTIHQLSKNDYIATLKNNVLVYEKPLDIMIYNDYEGSMYYVNNNLIDFAVTGNHRMWVSKFDEIKNKWLPHDFERADDIIGRYRRYKKNAYYNKEDYLSHILTNEFLEIYGKNLLDGKIPKWIYKISRKQMKSLLSRIENKFLTSNIDLVKNIQQMSLHAGYSASIEEIEINKDIKYLITILKNYDELEPIINDGIKELFIENVKCPVFCLKVSSEVFYVRRNGKCAWTGNSRAQGHITLLFRQPLGSITWFSNSYKEKIKLIFHLFLL